MIQNTPAFDEFPACFDQNIGLNFGKNTHIRFSFIPFTHVPIYLIFCNFL